VMALSALLEQPFPSAIEPVEELTERLLDLLDRAIEESGGEEELILWRVQLDGARIGGPLHEEILVRMHAGILLHDHGEYGARLGLPGRVFAFEADQRRAAELLAEDDGSLGDAERERAVETVHRGFVTPEEPGCTRCHGDAPGDLPFEDLGYTASRASALRASEVVRQVESAAGGETFYLPTLLNIEGHEEQAEDEEELEELDAPEPGDQEAQR
jgi:hypothetical protein